MSINKTSKLNELIEKGNKIKMEKSFIMHAFDAWVIEVKNVLIEIYGSNSPNIRSFMDAGIFTNNYPDLFPMSKQEEEEFWNGQLKISLGSKINRLIEYRDKK